MIVKYREVKIDEEHELDMEQLEIVEEMLAAAQAAEWEHAVADLKECIKKRRMPLCVMCEEFAVMIAYETEEFLCSECYIKNLEARRSK